MLILVVDFFIFFIIFVGAFVGIENYTLKLNNQSNKLISLEIENRWDGVNEPTHNHTITSKLRDTCKNKIESYSVIFPR